MLENKYLSWLTAASLICLAALAPIANAAASPLTVAPPDPVARSWFFAEGTTAYGFEEYICVQNPTTDTAVVQATYMTGTGQTKGDAFELAASSRATINVAAAVPQADVSVRVDSDRPVVCERSMYWGNRTEGHDSVGVTSASLRWYLAEGCTDYGFEEYVSIQNPGAASSTVNITYNTRTGPRKRAPLTVPALTRKTVRVNDDVPADDVSVTLSATKPVVAERSMYWDGRRGGHDSIGTSSASANWFLAEGSTKWGFDTYILLQNPGGSAVSVALTFLTEAGPVAAPQLPVGAGARVTVNPRTFLGNADFSTQVTANAGIICERSMYWNNGTGKAGHDTIGAKRPTVNCFLAEGTTQYGFETFVMIANPNSEVNNVVLEYMTPQGVDPGETVTMAPGSRVTVNVNAAEPGRDVSIKVSGEYPIVAERAMYWNSRGGGHDSIGWMTD